MLAALLNVRVALAVDEIVNDAVIDVPLVAVRLTVRVAVEVRDLAVGGTVLVLVALREGDLDAVAGAPLQTP